MDSIGEFFGQKDAFAKSCGIELLNVRPGSVNAGSELKKEQPGGIGLARAGAVFTSTDFVFAVASNGRNAVAVAINPSISYLRTAKDG